MKTKKINLNELKVESFVTSLEGKDSQTLKGGSSVLCLEVVASVVFAVAYTFVSMDVVDDFVLSGDGKKKLYRREPGMFD